MPPATGAPVWSSLTTQRGPRARASSYRYPPRNEPRWRVIGRCVTAEVEASRTRLSHISREPRDAHGNPARRFTRKSPAALVHADVEHPLGLYEEEYAALRQLQVGAQAPPAEHPVWTYLLATELMSTDWDVRPPAVRLTAGGWSYPTD